MTGFRFFIVSVILLAGCAGSITTTDGRVLSFNSSEFSDYFQYVFREQNQTATALAFAQEAAVVDRERLLTLEDALLGACAELNALASARRDDNVPGLRQQARMARTAPACEAATLEVRAALDAGVQERPRRLD